MSEGFVKLHRSILNHPAFKGPQERWAFMELVALAAWKKTTVRYKDRVIPLERGQLSISIRDFARRMEWEQTRVLRFFKMLENHNMIRRSVCNTHPGVLTICNYCKYQDDKNQFATADATPTATAPQQRRNTEQEREELKEGKKEDIYSPSLPLDGGNVTTLPKRVNGKQAAFGDFWKSYPRREGKIAAEKSFDRALRQAPASEIMAGLSRAVAFWQETGKEREFIPLPATWLNQGRWCDEFEPPGGGGISDAEVERIMREKGL